MSRIDALEAEADRRRDDFAATLHKFKRKISPLGLADEALRRLDPKGEAVTSAGRALRRNPLPVVPLLLGLSWLALKARAPRKPAGGRRKVKSLIQSQEKELNDENRQKTQNKQEQPQNRPQGRAGP